jgi:hypothetical protein
MIAILDLKCNPIYNIIGPGNYLYYTDFSHIREKVNILNRFQFTYYLLKFKQRFIGAYLRRKRMNYIRLLEGTFRPDLNSNSDSTVDNFGFYYLLNENICKEIVSFV